jgi:hypothetical protein
LEVTDAELARLAVAQVLPRFNDERHRPRPAPTLVGHLEAAHRQVPAPARSSADVVRIWDGT